MKSILLFPLIIASLGVAACNKSSGEASTTKMTNVEVVDGTISDDMILLDTSQGDGTSIDANATGGLYETIDNGSGGDTGAPVSGAGKDGSDASKILARKAAQTSQPAVPSASDKGEPAAKTDE